MDIFASPIKPYTQALVVAVPLSQAEQRETMILLEGDIPSATHILSGCRFQTRCPEKIGAISEEVEPLTHYFLDGSQVSCHLYP